MSQDDQRQKSEDLAFRGFARSTLLIEALPFTQEDKKQKEAEEELKNEDDEEANGLNALSKGKSSDSGLPLPLLSCGESTVRRNKTHSVLDSDLYHVLDLCACSCDVHDEAEEEGEAGAEDENSAAVREQRRGGRQYVTWSSLGFLQKKSHLRGFCGTFDNEQGNKL